MLIFKSIKFKNILSYGNTFSEFDFTQNKTVLFQGDSGSGKSTLLSALTFCLFGKPFTNIRKANLVNSINNSNLLVEVNFSIGKNTFRICRGIKPNIFEIYQNETLINQEAAMIDYQEFLENQILKFNIKTFLQIVILGSANFIPFMQLSSGERRNLVEEILDISSFTRMNEHLKEDVSNLKTEIKEIEHKKSILSTEISLHEKYKEKAKQESEQKKIELENELVKLDEQHSKVQFAHREYSTKLRNQTQEKNKILEALGKLKQSIKTLESKRLYEIDKLDKKLNYFDNNEQCDTCLQSITIDHKTNIQWTLNKEKELCSEKYDSQIKSASIKIKSLEQSNVFARILQDEESLKNKINVLNEKNSMISVKRKMISDQLKSFFDDKKIEDRDIIVEKKKSLDILEKKYIECMAESQIKEYAAILLKDNGIKTDIIKEYLVLINSTINEYLAKMNFFVKFTLDENFSEKIEARGRDDFEYDCFSEGEKQRLDLAILFTWRKIAQLKNSLNCNLLIMDEIADSKLNEEAAESVWDVLKSPEFNDSNVFVISHKNTISSKFEKVYNFSKKGNFTLVSHNE